MRLILASGSPRRKELMEQIGLQFKVITSQAEEVTTQTEPGEMVKELSGRKARAVLQNLLHSKEQDDFSVIGADTIVVYHGQVYGKPENEQMAYHMIQSLSGDVHQVYTGVTIIGCDGTANQFYEKTDVEVFSMEEHEIWDYISTGDPMDKAGAYGIQGPFAAYIKGIQGDYNNVVGLPIARLYHVLKDMKLIDHQSSEL